MRKPDLRGRRVRNTLNVDLGQFGKDTLDQAVELLNADRRRRFLRADELFNGLKRFNRGRVIRLALAVLLSQLEGRPSPLVEVRDLLGTRPIPE